MTQKNDQNMRDAKLGIKKDATHGANDEAKHAIDLIAK